MPMKLNIFLSTALFPTEVDAAQDHSPYSVSVEHIPQPAVCFANVDLGKLTWVIGHAFGDNGHENEVFVRASFGEIGDGNLFGIYFGTLKRTCAFGAC